MMNPQENSVTSTTINKKLLEYLCLDFGSFYFYEDCVIGEMNRGSIVDFEKLHPIFKAALLHYKEDISFVYISNRIHSYSVVPTSHFQLRGLFPNLKGYAIVSYNDKTTKIADLERTFFNRPMDVFSNLKDAISWSDQLLASF
ncbi:hypothetical protein [Aquimarina rhabdastrellae]